MNILTAHREVEGKNGESREVEREKGEVAESYCKRRENEIHRASYCGRYFSPPRIYSPLSRPRMRFSWITRKERKKQNAEKT
jgi:hypothetical protein